MSATERASSGYAPSMGDILDQYEELSETVSRDPGVAADNRRLADLALSRAKAEAWDEGWAHAVKVYRASGTGPRTRNPYKP